MPSDADLDKLIRRTAERIVAAQATPLSKTESDQLKTQMARVKLYVAGTGCFLDWWLRGEVPMTDNSYAKAAEIVSAAGYGSNEIIRNGLGIGYARAAEIIKELQSAGILGTELDADARLELRRPCGFY